MADEDGAQKSVKDWKAESFAKTVEAIQERARREGFDLDGSSDKPIMNEA